MVFKVASVSAMIMAAGGPSVPSFVLPRFVKVALVVGAEHDQGGHFRRGGAAARMAVVVLQTALVAANAGFELDQRLVEGGVGVGARAARLKLLAGRQMHHDIDAEAMAVLADGDIRVPAPFEVFADSRDGLVDDALSERLAHIHMLARNLNVHRRRHFRVL